MGDATRSPTVPVADREGWTLTEENSEVVFSLPTATIEGHTVVYEDKRLRRAVREATDGQLDRMWRFFFATRLTFSPPLPPGIGPMAVFSTVRSEAESEFEEILRDRGFADVTRGRSERIRVGTGDRARLRTYEATLTIEYGGETRTLDVVGWLGVWTTEGSFRLAGGAYPGTPLADVLDLEPDRRSDDLETGHAGYRDELLSLIRDVR